MKASMKDPANWTTQDLNEIMMEADELYYNVLMVSDPEKIPPSGYLLVNNLSVLNNVVHLFETKFTFHFASEPEIFGDVNNDYGFGFVLATGLEELFKKHSSGILIANNKSVAVMSLGESFFFWDSHSCGFPDGPASLSRHETIADMCNALQRSLGTSDKNKNHPFTIDFIDVSRK